MADNKKPVKSKKELELLKKRSEASKKLNAANKGKRKPSTDY